MQTVFQEIIEIATAKLKEALNQETDSAEWDSDAFEQEVQKCTRQLGQECLRTWAEVKTEQARAEARICPCGQKRQDI
jgi:hypothetical protein